MHFSFGFSELKQHCYIVCPWGQLRNTDPAETRKPRFESSLDLMQCSLSANKTKINSLANLLKNKDIIN